MPITANYWPAYETSISIHFMRPAIGGECFCRQRSGPPAETYKETPLERLTEYLVPKIKELKKKEDVLRNEKECINRGGSWNSGGKGFPFRCYLKTADGGNRCYDSSQCESYCVVKKEDTDKIGPMGECSNLTSMPNYEYVVIGNEIIQSECWPLIER